jgi:hypothetical protein
MTWLCETATHYILLWKALDFCFIVVRHEKLRELDVDDWYASNQMFCTSVVLLRALNRVNENMNRGGIISEHSGTEWIAGALRGYHVFSGIANVELPLSKERSIEILWCK